MKSFLLIIYVNYPQYNYLLRLIDLLYFIKGSNILFCLLQVWYNHDTFIKCLYIFLQEFSF